MYVCAPLIKDIVYCLHMILCNKGFIGAVDIYIKLSTSQGEGKGIHVGIHM